MRVHSELLDCRPVNASSYDEERLTVSVRDDGPWDWPNRGIEVRRGYGTDPRWLPVLKDGLQQRPLRIEATSSGRLVGALPLALIESRLFGRFLVSLPYVNTAGVVVQTDHVAGATTHHSRAPTAGWSTTHQIRHALIDRAVELADEFDVRYLELRHETAVEHPAFNFERTDKVHMRLDLPESTDELRTALKASVRNQVKKGESYGLDVGWGREDVLPDFYRVFSRNMRDLGTPVFGRRLFAAILQSFGNDAEFCVVRKDGRPIAAALLIHAGGVTQVPSASSLREFNRLNANMLMYWRLLARAVERGSRTFDFGRSSEGSGTYRFKKQWGTQPFPSVWQYYVRQGDANAMRPDSAGNQRLIRFWKRLPLWLANSLGPRIVRGIP